MNQVITLLWAILLLVFCASAHSAPPTPPATSAPVVVTPPAKDQFDIYLLMGQSNMQGRDTRTLASQKDNPHILALNADNQWVIARDPMFPPAGRIKPGRGPGIPFALAMLKADPNVTIGLVPCAVGGTPLRRWVKGGDLYENAVKQAKLAARFGVIKGVLWHQGESDTTTQENADTYEARLTQMFQDLRQDLGQPALPIVVGQLGDFLALTPKQYPYLDTVRAAIQHIPTVLSYVGYADSAGLGDRGDKLHFSAEAQETFGARYAKAMQELQKVQTPLRIVIVGDSTVCNYPLTRPDRGWGQFIQERFQPGTVTVINLAAAGRSTKTFIQEGRWKKALEEKPDYVLIQFGHNDSHSPDHPEATNAATDYQEYLRRYINDSRAIGAAPILVTPMVRRTFDANGKLTDALQPYAEAMKAVGAETKTPVIDLHASSKRLVEQLGPEKSAEMANKPGDATHFNEKGARAMAALVMDELPTAAPTLKAYLLVKHGTP